MLRELRRTGIKTLAESLFPDLVLIYFYASLDPSVSAGWRITQDDGALNK